MTYTEQYNKAKLNPSKVPEIKLMTNRILANRKRYEGIQAINGCPWWCVGMIHMMEAGGKKNPFAGHLHNGDPLTAKTVNVPKGRPAGNPPFTWEQSALDAIAYMEGANRTWRRLKGKWDFESTLEKLEAYNGLGYKRMGVPSPYLWSYTDFYVSGKYVADNKYDPKAVSKQPGVCAMMKVMGITP